MSAPGFPQFNQLIDAVQRNCHIADARHAREMTLCTYLLEMREFYRWEAGIPLGDPLLRADVGDWLTAREALWETLADADFVPLPLADAEHEPFAVAAINAALMPHGLVYGAGIGRFGKPHFFLGRLARHERHDDLAVMVCECEYARDLIAIPAALQRDAVIVRREALRQWLWEKAEAWNMKQTAGALSRALEAHGYAANPRAALERMTDAETDSVILHERGERAAGRRLGPQWEDMLAGFRQRRAEILVRAVRDHLADCLVTLPVLLERQAWPQLWFWLANLDGMRRELVPGVGTVDFAKVDAVDTLLRDLVQRGPRHWEDLAHRLLASDEASIEKLTRNIGALALA